MNQLTQLMQMHGGLAMAVAGAMLVAGIAMNYCGRVIYLLVVYLSGAVWGGFLGAAGSIAFNHGQISWVAVIIVALIFGGLAVMIQFLFFVLVGAAVAALLALAAGVAQPDALAIAGLVGGCLAAFLFRWAIIFSTCLTGSALLLFASVNLAGIAENGYFVWRVPSLFGYVGHLANAAIQHGGLPAARSVGTDDALLFLAFFVSGFVVQAGWVPVGSGNESESAEDAKREEAGRGQIEAQAEAGNPEQATGVGKVSLFEDGALVRTVALQTGRYVLGRETGCDLLLSDPAVSRRHLELEMEPSGRLWLRDLGFSTGTWRAGHERVTEECPQPDQWYQIGRAQILFHA